MLDIFSRNRFDIWAVCIWRLRRSHNSRDMFKLSISDKYIHHGFVNIDDEAAFIHI